MIKALQRLNRGNMEFLRRLWHSRVNNRTVADWFDFLVMGFATTAMIIAASVLLIGVGAALILWLPTLLWWCWNTLAPLFGLIRLTYQQVLALSAVSFIKRA